jgi:exopolyphosphatase/guanosine-5'-triphosphate,3'-diphosphate pyrophosphatase
VSARLAAVDLGTVTARLLIADVDSEGIHELERHMRITHLGEDLDKTGRIGAAAIDRERAACAEFLEAIDAVGHSDGRPVERVLAVATSAMRDAANSHEVLDALASVGLAVEVISGSREACLSFLGTLSGFCTDEVTDGVPVLSVDVGGGSTELILGVVEGSGRPRILKEHSFDIGSRRVTDRFLRSDPPSDDEIECARAWAEQTTCGYFAGLEPKPQLMIAVAGTATSVVSVRDKMVSYDPWKVHGACVAVGQLNKVLNKLAELDLGRRRHCVGLEPGRASVIVGGLITLQAVLKQTGLGSFTVSETDILQGILLDAG